MSDVRRVSPIKDSFDSEIIYDLPNGTHMLVPVETWERVVGALREIVALNVQGDSREEMVCVAEDALAEIGEE
jgi:hypothetical protein